MTNVNSKTLWELDWQLFLWRLYDEGRTRVFWCVVDVKKTSRSWSLGKVSKCVSLLGNPLYHLESGMVKNQLALGLGMKTCNHGCLDRRSVMVRIFRSGPRFGFSWSGPWSGFCGTDFFRPVRGLQIVFKPFPVNHCHRLKSKTAST